MNTPQGTSISLHDPSTPVIARLADTAGRDGPATPREVAGHLQSGGFFWLDLEDPGDDELAEFGPSLQLSAGAIDGMTHASQRSSFALVAGSVRAVLPAAVGTRSAAWGEANYVTLLLTGQFLLEEDEVSDHLPGDHQPRSLVDDPLEVPAHKSDHPAASSAAGHSGCGLATSPSPGDVPLVLWCDHREGWHARTDERDKTTCGYRLGAGSLPGDVC